MDPGGGGMRWLVHQRDGPETRTAGERRVADGKGLDVQPEPLLPEDIGHAVVFFASPKARSITGQALNVDGGTATAVVISQTARLTTAHVVLLSQPKRAFYAQPWFWGAAVAGGVIGYFVHGR